MPQKIRVTTCEYNEIIIFYIKLYVSDFKIHSMWTYCTWPIKWVVRKPPCEPPSTAIFDGLASPKFMTWSIAVSTSLTSCIDKLRSTPDLKKIRTQYDKVLELDHEGELL